MSVVRYDDGLREQVHAHELVPLSERLVRGRPDIAAFFKLAIQLCSALADLHRRELVHNGIQPSAILVDETYDRVQLRDSSLARRVPIEARSLVGELLAAGVASYMAPEQTGRVNRAIDHRADLYALGATFHELLSGRPPFEAAEALELIHCHIAKSPPPLISPEIPRQVSLLVLRLLAKGAEDRYQSALGVRHDLERCRREWAKARTIPTFVLGERDVSDRLLISQRLYGRSAELRELTDAFDAAREGHKGLLLVSGSPGVGKTAFIHELCRPIARQRGYFIAGKFDQVVRSVPYGALIQAFRSLFWLILAETEERLAGHRAALTAALGNNGGVIAEVIPELELILGKQVVPPQLDANEAQNRFRYVFENFVGAFAQPAQPLVIFLDDLQWTDAATLDLLHALLTGSERRHLLIIGAYRDDEVDARHPLRVAIERIQAAGASPRRVALGSLALSDLVAFVSDTLRSSPSEIEPLAQLIRQKTDGNPFFVIQFLKTLAQDGLIAFDHEHARWLHQIDAIGAAGITDNVVALMTRRIQRLSSGAQAVLRLAACIGSPFDRHTLSIAHGGASSELDAGLAEALRSGLIEPTAAGRELGEAGAAYAFIHDRVQQAAYASIAPDQRAGAHLELGRSLWRDLGADVPEEHLFALLTHLNVGRALLEPSERLPLARLNHAAGRKAKGSAAYQAASGYLEAALELLDESHFASDHALAFAIHLDAAECRYLAGDFDAAHRACERLIAHARGPLDRASVHSLMVVANENMARYAEAVASGREGLALFGIALPEAPDALRAGLEQEIARIEELRAGRSIGALAGLPLMTDTNVQMVMRILTSVWAPAYIQGNELQARFISASMVRLSLAHGNTEDSAYGYVTHAVTVGPIMRDFQAAHDWGELALRVNERFGDAKRRAKIHQQIHAHVKLWSRPFASCIPHAREARRTGLESGDFNYAGYGAATESWPGFLINTDLERFVREHQPNLELLDRIKMSSFRDALRLMLNWARALQGRTRGRCSLSDAQFDEDDYHARYASSAPLLLTFLFTARLHLATLMQETAQGISAARAARQVTLPGTIWPVLTDFWAGLALAAAYDGASEPDRAEYRAEISAAERSLAELAESCPENYRCFWLLIAAELARIDGRLERALQHCEEAMNYARLTDNLQQQALATELCARTLLARGEAALAHGYLSEAYRCYAAWGAHAKLRQLEERYGLPQPQQTELPERAEGGAHASPHAAAAYLDVRSVIKIAQAIAGEIELDALLAKFLRIALENAGAEHGTFLHDADGHSLVRAVARFERDAIRISAPGRDDDAGPLVQSVARYVRRTGLPLVIGDTRNDERFAADAARSRRTARSLLCTPVSHQRRIAGVLVLESGLADAFGRERLEIVQVLATQAAISLENARLYAEMRSEVGRRQQAEQELRVALDQVEALKNRLEAENVYLQEEIGTQHNFNEIVGHSPPLLAALRKIERVAPTDSSVLILGETGSGKELIARAVHARSRRRERALVKVNCGAIAPGLVESELFGHVKGAFTGAVDRRVGRFELADGGTLFLDEVGELPPEAQVKLLRALQEHEFEPVGSSRTVRVDVRVITATNRNLEVAVREGRFRADLLYRLNVFPVEVPPLRERVSDIPLLVGSFVAGLARKLGKPLTGFSVESLEAMRRYGWPGNVRELQNVVERAAILATGPVLEFDEDVRSRADGDGDAAPQSSSMAHIQRAHIESVLRATGGLIEGSKGAAAVLGMHPNTLRSRMKKLGITSPSRSGARHS